MCGITGFFKPRGFHEADASNDAIRMRDSLVHRGPDDSGLWIDAKSGIALAHRRLSIVDLSIAGRQPMKSPSGRYMIVFNGEIYNHLELRELISTSGHHNYIGNSDTETLLVAIEVWGLEKALQNSVGMFALALWDHQEQCLSLARDRMGEKPLYYGWQGDTFLFGSELKALKAHPSFRSEIDHSILPSYLRHGYIPTPYSVWKGIRKLTPGCILRINQAQLGCDTAPAAYWSLANAVSQGKRNLFRGTEEEATDELEALLRKAVSGQMMADVPLGAFLSGGIDSTTVVAMMQTQSTRPVKTFTIGFDEDNYDEAKHAKVVAKHLGTDHTELYVTAQNALEIIPLLPNIYDEPFGDSSAIPTHLVSQLARQHVTVSLSGDGGDELFGGYQRYFTNQKIEDIWRKTRTAAPIQRLVASLIRSPLATVSEELLQSAFSSLRVPLNKSLSAKAVRIADIMEAQDFNSFYRSMTSQWSLPPVARRSATPVYGIENSTLDQLPLSIEKMMAIDCVTYLPDDILTKVDRAAMAVSLETRVPLLDHRIIELAWRMPPSLKVKNDQGKWLLRQVLYRHVPPAMIERPKMGFGVPVDQWLRGPLRDWAEDLLEEKGLKESGFLDAKPVRTRWTQHLAGQHNWKSSLWLVLMWQAWLKQI